MNCKFAAVLVSATMLASVEVKAAKRETSRSVISAGGNHVLAIRRDGWAWAWGAGTSGQLGNGVPGEEWHPVPGPGYDFNYVSAGIDHGLGIKNDGTLWIWGAPWADPMDIATPVEVPGSGWTNACGGLSHNVGIKADGTLWTWGSNGYGQLGRGTGAPSWDPNPVQVGSDTKWKYITCGENSSLAIKADGSLWAWGRNEQRQLGLGDNVNRYTPVRVGTGNDWVKVVTKYHHTLGIRADGSLWGWGWNLFGQVGNGSASEWIASPAVVGSDKNWTDIAPSYLHSLALKADGRMYGWGASYFAQDPDVTPSSTPRHLPSTSHWVAIAVTSYANLAFDANGDIYSWGQDVHGELGRDLAGAYVTNPDRVIGVLGVARPVISAGQNHTAWLGNQGFSSAFGNNAFGKLGVGGTTNQLSPTPLSLQFSRCKLISGGINHTLGLKANGTLWAWGNDSYGQMGNGTQGASQTPVQCGTETNWKILSAGGDHSLGIKADGSLWAWGRANQHQVGDAQAIGPTPVNRSSPVAIGGTQKWQAVAGGFEHSAAIRADGTLWTWGRNNYGQLGKGNTNTYNAPTQVTLPTTEPNNTWIAVECGEYHTVALKADGSMWTWGRNNHGQLGDGTSGATAFRSTPARIASGRRWVQIDVNSKGNHSLALDADGLPHAWGYNSDYQIGNGSIADQLTPFTLALPRMSEVTAGGSHSFAHQPGGLWAWGLNSSGQIGDGTTTTVTGPLIVLEFDY